jgi:hypothetical protein
MAGVLGERAANWKGDRGDPLSGIGEVQSVEEEKKVPMTPPPPSIHSKVDMPKTNLPKFVAPPAGRLLGSLLRSGLLLRIRVDPDVPWRFHRRLRRVRVLPLYYLHQGKARVEIELL